MMKRLPHSMLHPCMKDWELGFQRKIKKNERRSLELTMARD
jgi:hypothetical protein